MTSSYQTSSGKITKNVADTTELSAGTAYRHVGVYSGLPVTTVEYIVQTSASLLLPQTTGNGYLSVNEPPIELLRVPLYLGDSWSQTVRAIQPSLIVVNQRQTTVVGQEEITVPAGTFTCVKLHVKVNSDEHDEWWSSDVGLVKSSDYNTQLLTFSKP